MGAGLVRRWRGEAEGCTEEGDTAAPGATGDAVKEGKTFAESDGRAGCYCKKKRQY